MHGFMRSAISLAACISAAALLFMPVALQQTGTAGVFGLLAAAGICLGSGVVAEGASIGLAPASPLGAMLIGMMVRMFAPLAVCVAILASGQSGREHLPFIGYLLTFYMATLGLETWLSLKRAAGQTSQSNRSPR
jgi:hypothetical protein